jgi:chromosome segregation ATPase
MEGVMEEVQLPEEVHTKICKIINESGMSDKTALKEFIYSIQGYDLSRERKLFESAEDPQPSKSEQEISETTLSLLKESSSQIENLKADNMALKTKNTSLVAESENLKARLNESLDQLTKLSIESKKQETVISESTSNHNDTIAKLEARIDELKSVLEDKDLELEELSGVKEAFKALQSENAGMKSSVYNEQEIAESFQSYSTKVEGELKEAYSEISSMIKELSDKEAQIQELTESVEDLELKLSTANKNSKNLKNQISSLKSEKVQLVRESKEDDSKASNRIEELEEENSKLNEMVERLNESVDKLTEDLNTSVNESNTNSVYADSLIEVIAGNYGMSVNAVKPKLPENFTKDDVYRVCESFSNSVINGVSYENISESVVTTKSSYNNSTSPNEPKIASIMGNVANRRGLKAPNS